MPEVNLNAINVSASKSSDDGQEAFGKKRGFLGRLFLNMSEKLAGEYR